MRTTMNLPDDLFRGAKMLAAKEGRTVTSIMEEALRRLLQEHERDQAAATDRDRGLPPKFAAALAAHKPPYRVRPLRGHGPLPDELICNNAALLDYLEGLDATADS